jgi:alkanesulfonate monooxygenase SsuD/methylene tetrahydromethanopterin reductase-like flavin-dependent oxidoreductase (luciferase family)
MTDDAISSDLADLRKEFEGSGFTLGTVWASAGAGPDARRLFASHGTMLITAWNAAELRMRIREEMRRSQQTAWEA